MTPTHWLCRKTILPRRSVIDNGYAHPYHCRSSGNLPEAAAPINRVTCHPKSTEEISRDLRVVLFSCPDFNFFRISRACLSRCARRQCHGSNGKTPVKTGRPDTTTSPGFPGTLPRIATAWGRHGCPAGRTGTAPFKRGRRCNTPVRDSRFQSVGEFTL